MTLGAPADRIHVVVSGVPYPTPIAREDARGQLGLADETLCILWIGRLAPVKQPQHVIHAFEKLRSLVGRNALLVMIGDGQQGEAVRDLVRQRGLDGAVRFAGHCPRETVWAWQCAADVLVNSSSSEGTPRAVLEALGGERPQSVIRSTESRPPSAQ